MGRIAVTVTDTTDHKQMHTSVTRTSRILATKSGLILSV